MGLALAPLLAVAEAQVVVGESCKAVAPVQAVKVLLVVTGVLMAQVVVEVVQVQQVARELQERVKVVTEVTVYQVLSPVQPLLELGEGEAVLIMDHQARRAELAVEETATVMALARQRGLI